MFIDFRQAYDRVPRNKLLSLLAEYGCGHRMLAAIAGSLKNTRSLLNTVLIDSSMGVRQGGSSSCFLFTLYVNPLIRKLKQLNPDGYLHDLHTLLMMDDTVIFATSRDAMNEKLRVLYEYCQEYNMVINQSKTKFFAINADDESPFVHNDLTVSRTNSYTYLGAVVFNDTVAAQVASHVDSKKSHCRKFSSFLARNCDAPFGVKQTIWNAALNSAILYGSETWMTHNLKSVESVYMRTLKELLGVKVQTPNDICLVEAGATPLKGLIVEKQFQFVNKLCSYSHFQGSPAQFVMNLIKESRSPMGRYLLWLEGLTHENFAAASVTDLRAKITGLVASSSRMASYVRMNPDLSPPVIKQVPEHHRKAFTRIRLGSHHLRIETGRWSRTPRENRVCNCDGASIQTEEHVLCFCSLTENLRVSNSSLNFSDITAFFKNSNFDLVCRYTYQCLGLFL